MPFVLSLVLLVWGASTASVLAIYAVSRVSPAANRMVRHNLFGNDRAGTLAFPHPIEVSDAAFQRLIEGEESETIESPRHDEVADARRTSAFDLVSG